jgi:hypothetical protein
MPGLERPLNPQQQGQLRYELLQHHMKLSREMDAFAKRADRGTAGLLEQANIHLRQIASLLDTLTESAELMQARNQREQFYIRWGLLALVALNVPTIVLRLNDLAKVVHHLWSVFP